MKKAFLILAFLVVALCSTAFAQCVATPLMDQVKIGDFGQILVPTQYTINDKVEPAIDWITYFPEDLKEMSDAEIKALFEKNISDRCGEILVVKYEKENEVIITEERKKIALGQLSRIKSISTSEIQKNATEVSLDKIGIFEVTADGQKTDISISVSGDSK